MTFQSDARDKAIIADDHDEAAYLNSGKQCQDLEDSEYRRMLDSLARFYNSQITAHAGYMLATGLGLVTILLQSDRWISLIETTFGEYGHVDAARLELLGALWFLTGAMLLLVIVSPFLGRISRIMLISPIYHYGRLQYYIALTEIVWLHMGLVEQHVDRKLFQLLKDRALCSSWRHENMDRSLGMVQAVKTLFEARLYISLRRMKASNYELDDEGQALFNLSEYYTVEHTMSSYGGLKRDLMFSIYRKTLRGYRLSELKKAPSLREKTDDEIKEYYFHKIGELFEGYLDA